MAMEALMDKGQRTWYKAPVPWGDTGRLWAGEAVSWGRG